MAKTVFSSHAAVAASWARGDASGRVSSGRMSHSNGVIVSYGSHFVIARRTTGADGLPVVLFTTRGYGNATAKHIGHVRRVINYGRGLRVCYVERPENPPQTADMLTHIEAAKESLAKAMRARTYRDLHAADVERHVQRARDLAAAFALSIPADYAAEMSQLVNDAAALQTRAAA